MEELRILGYMKWDMERIQTLHEKVRQDHEKNVFSPIYEEAIAG